MKKIFLIILFSTSVAIGQNDTTLLRSFYDMALSNGESYENLRSLCKDVGARLTGSAQADMAIEWAKNRLESYNFENVYLQKIPVQHWERGTSEVGWFRTEDGTLHQVKLLALGGSIGTNGRLEGQLIEFDSISELEQASKEDIEGKIVFINQAMDEQLISTFEAYGGCYPIRRNGCVEASQLGARAVIIRSLGLAIDDHPHTGSLHYNDEIPKIPGAAISTQSAEALSLATDQGNVEFILEMDCRQYPDIETYNVIAEITGSEHPDEYIVFGGHLDSWDVGEGAHDDGAGVVHCIEALRILKEHHIRPKHTLRLVLWMNEENGNGGGIHYAKMAAEKGEKHIAAVESDRGGFTPRGFAVDGKEEHLQWLQGYEGLLAPYNLHKFEAGFSGVDINPLKDYYADIALFGYIPDSQRYFDFHHTDNDVFENVNKRELELGCASMASMLYLIDRYLDVK